MMGSEQVSQRWVEGLERVCRECGAAIKSLARDLGQVHRNADGSGWVLCMGCTPAGKAARRREDAQAREGSGASAC